jgi:hypothetical protein
LPRRVSSLGYTMLKPPDDILIPLDGKIALVAERHQYRVPKSGTPAMRALVAGTLRRVAPFPFGETEQRHRRLIAKGYVIREGPHGFTVFRFFKDRDRWK